MQRREFEGLRRLHDAQRRAVDGAGDACRPRRRSSPYRRPECTGTAAPAPARGGDRPRHQRRQRRTGAPRHAPARSRATRTRAPRAHCGRMPAASRRRGPAQAGKSGRCRREARGVVGMDDWLHAPKSPGGRASMARLGPDHRLPGDLPILLGQVAARAQPAAGGDDDGCDVFSMRYPGSIRLKPSP